MTDFCEIKVGSVTFKLREPHDFSWLDDLGNPFTVFDQQDSGNICFGIERNGKKIFIKYAGAKTTEYTDNPTDAVSRLQSSIQAYVDLKHDTLITYRDSFSTKEGFVVVFDWFDGENFHQHWLYPPPEKYTNPKSAYCMFRKLPLAIRLRALDKIFAFHKHVERCGYLAVDFYDGSILYNFERNEIKICDIDYYSKQKPYINTMCWGSKRFKAPEDNIKGATLDARTNVYNMGATAFSLIGGELKRTFEKWDGSEKLFAIAKKATNDDRDERYSTVEEFYDAWTRNLQ